jgi:hypothetical protein
MSIERFANTASTTLNNGGTLLSGDTSCTVTSAAAFPSGGNFRILIGSEIILVTAVSSNTFTITRGQEGTSAASHADSSTVTHVLTASAVQALQLGFATTVQNTSNATYTCDSTGPVSDVVILHGRTGATTYVMPAPTNGRRIEIIDVTDAIETANTNGFITGTSAFANTIFIAPNGNELFNTISAFALSGTAYHFTNGSTAVTATSSHFTTELAPGMTIQSSNQSGVNYKVGSISSDTSLTLAVNFTGTTTTTATSTMTSLAYYANGGRLSLVSDGSNWYASSNKPLRAKFTASGTFIPSQGCYMGLLRGAGGGGGGGGGVGNSATRSGGAGGGGSTQTSPSVQQTPNTTITVTIGAGGSAGTSGSGGNGGNGGAGGASTYGSLATFPGASGGGGGTTTSGQVCGGGTTITDGAGNNIYGIAYASADAYGGQASSLSTLWFGSGSGGSVIQGASAGQLYNGASNTVGGFAGGTHGTGSPGAGGGAGPAGAGGNGGNGSVISPTSGSAGSVNTGAGGGGGGAGGSGGGVAGATGGAGGSGYIEVLCPM